jgi:hypothetical protein
MDRGRGQRIFGLLRRLERKPAGRGMVHVLLGNHELASPASSSTILIMLRSSSSSLSSPGSTAGKRKTSF